MTLFAALYRLLLRLTGASFQTRYGREALDVACRRVAARRRIHRPIAAVRELADLLVTARRERRADRARRPAALRPRHGLAGIAQDFRTAARSLRATPGFTAIALVVLTLGIGASTAIFSVVDAVVLRGLPFDEADRILRIGRISPERPRPGVETAPTFFDWQREQDVFDELAAVAGIDFSVLEGGAGDPEALNGRRITANLFRVLRVSPALGRAFTASDETAGQPRVVIISDGLWRRRFGADREVLGRTMRTEAATWTIVGVMPRGFTYPLGQVKPVDVWMPFVPAASDRTRNAGRNFTWQVIGRLKAGVSAAQAGTRMQQITSALAQQYPDWFRDAGTVGVISLAEALVGYVRPWMVLLVGAVGLVLLLACVNVANLMLARALGRHRETAVRTALGGTRWRLARGLLVESLVLSGVGTAFGVVLANWGVAVLKASMPQGVPRLDSIAVDGRVLAVAAIASAVTGLLFGSLPAIHGSRADVVGGLKEGGRGASAGAPGRRLRGALVMAEVTLTAVLLVGAGLFIASFARFARVDLGFDTERVLTFDAYLNYRDPSWRLSGRAFVADIVGKLQEIPGVSAAAAVMNGLPLTGSWSQQPMTRPGRAVTANADGVVQRMITPGYFDVMRIPVRRGRVISDRDVVGADRVIVLSELAERTWFPGESAIGQIVTINKVDFAVVGVVGGTRFNGPESDVLPEAYVPLAQEDVPGADFALRASGDPDLLRASVAAAVHAIRPQQVIREMQTMRGFYNVYAERPRFTMQLLGLFGVLGTVITAVGIYGVISCLVAQRTREIGIRMALGARPSQVLARVIGQAATYIAVGLAIGLSVAWVLSQFATAFLFQVQARDVAIYATAAAVLFVAGVAAAGVPARRASRVDPLIALRSE